MIDTTDKRGDSMTIYVDVLLAVNLYINYFLIRGAAQLMRRRITAGRCLLAAAAGSLFSLCILLPELPFVLNALIKVVSCLATVIAAFGRQERSQLIISVLCFLSISFMYAGLMLALWMFAAPMGMLCRNGAVYFDIPIIAVTIFTIAAYGIVALLRYISDRNGRSCERAQVRISLGADSVRLTGISDTGNGLCDPFSGRPVVICSAERISEMIPESITKYLEGKTEEIEGLRLAPCHTIAGNVLVPLFNADIEINGKHCDAVVGVTDRPLGAECIFNPRLITL